MSQNAFERKYTLGQGGVTGSFDYIFSI